MQPGHTTHPGANLTPVQCDHMMPISSSWGGGSPWQELGEDTAALAADWTPCKPTVLPGGCEQGPHGCHHSQTTQPTHKRGLSPSPRHHLFLQHLLQPTAVGCSQQATLLVTGPAWLPQHPTPALLVRARLEVSAPGTAGIWAQSQPGNRSSLSVSSPAPPGHLHSQGSSAHPSRHCWLFSHTRYGWATFAYSQGLGNCSPSSAPRFSSDVYLPLGQTKPQTLVGCIPPPAPWAQPLPFMVSSHYFWQLFAWKRWELQPGRATIPPGSWYGVTGWPHRLPGAFIKGPAHTALLRAHSRLHAAPAASHRPLSPAKTCPRCQPGNLKPGKTEPHSDRDEWSPAIHAHKPQGM